MSDRPISLLIVDKDPIFRLGLATSLSSNSQWEISSQTDNLKDALNQLSSNTFDLIILDPNLINETLTIETFYQQAQTSQPEIKLCLLSYDLSLQQQEEFKKIGIEGYLNKGTFIENLLENWQRIIQGELIWPTITAGQLSEVKTETTQENWLSKVRKSGLEQINNNLQGLNENIKNRPTSKLDKIFWKGRKRELLTARWLVKQLLPMEVILLSPPASSRENFASTVTLAAEEKGLKIFDETMYTLSNNLDNLTNYSLEIDILKFEKRKEILEIVLKQLYRIISDIKFIERDGVKLSKTRHSLSILARLWRESALIFLSKYCNDQEKFFLEDIETIIEENEDIVSQEILRKIPRFPELFDFLLSGSEGSIQEMSQGKEEEKKILHNLLIQVANAIISLILNYFSNNEKIKERLYNLETVSSREIAKFRNRLAWEYRKQQYWGEPKDIFESQYRLFFFNEKGIDSSVIYSPRQKELNSLRGIKWSVTILLEIRDATSPLLRSLVGTVGKALVYVLTQVIGRGIGLVGKGILQGIGNSFSERDYQKKPAKQKSKY
ncbi:MAG: DUF3685 domain-containing protein [Crocosphaera sp.]|uniref:DUF3685 domain-containing protein n=1 Tax=Crocosphaera sp. TaxID=2729996 RepID=UPI00257E1D92|nr:DUF3685 domain-containing protein [Crocosphaera sp.]MCH2243300.1 DUF3685 domain-containing protein [Crocosphaera sp.]NQZ62018.1 DUF3685 domain-containing protein [Crocosphaera sp.]